jgi:hypothetical protein
MLRSQNVRRYYQHRLDCKTILRLLLHSRTESKLSRRTPDGLTSENLYESVVG